ncbi:S-adenosyl-L-methionine-dependent methyltransferase [Schizophyllum commune]
MKLSAIWGILAHLWLAVTIGFKPTLLAVFRDPRLLLRPTAVSRIFMAALWETFGPAIDQNIRAEKERLIRPHASGVVIDVGAGHGASSLYLDRAKVTKYVAVEPNVAMHDHIRRTAESVGFTDKDGSLVILECGIEDVAVIRAALGTGGPRSDAEGPCADTIISVLTLCSVPNPQETIRALVRDLLKPGGTLLFYEHVLSHRADVAWWQRSWAPIWRVPFDGCRLDQPTHLWIVEAGDEDNGGGEGLWALQETWGKDGEPEDALVRHRIGRFAKRD